MIADLADTEIRSGSFMNLIYKITLSCCLVFGILPLSADSAEIEQLITRDLHNLDNKTGDMIIVTYAPGESSMPHRHNAHTFVYVLKGRVAMQVDGGEILTLSAGQTFYESPEDIHVVSRNASDTEPAEILVFSVREKGTPLSMPVD